MAQTSCLVCCPLVANSVEEIVIQMHQAKADGADIIELRLDHLHNFNPNTHLQIILNQRLLPIIVTYRPKWEGGEYEGEEVTRLDTLRLALELGADYVDVELQVALTFIKSICEKKSRNSKIIVSSHNFQCTPSLKDLGELVTRIQDTGADVVKIATTATNITDVNRIFQVLSNPQEGLHAQSEMTAPVIALAMGMRGLISRILCPKFGGYVTFASIGIGKESASGQPTLTDLTKIYKIKNLSRDTKIFGIIGNPVGHSKGPILHNQAFREIGFDAIYVPFLVDDLSQFLTVYCTPDFAGFSVTIPHKEAALQCCDEVEPVAQSIGAVNTIVRRQSDGKLIGYNTDYMGAISAVVDGLKGRLGSGDWENTSPLSGRMFVVVGAGGAGKALAYGAKEKGARVAIANRNFERAKVLASLVGGEAIPLEKLDSFCPENGMILANTTSVGMHPNVNDTPISKVAETRFASHIIVLRQLVQVKDALQSMVIRNNWGVWKKKNTERENKIKDRLLADSWWECVEYLLKITESIMSMLRYTDMDRPWLGEIYDGIDSMIEKIRQVIHEEEQDPQETFFKQVQQIINERWNKMTTPLHFLAYALTPKYYSSQYCDLPGRLPPYRDMEVSDGYRAAFRRIFLDDDIRDVIMDEFIEFVNARGLSNDALHHWFKKDAHGWWYLHGQKFRTLQPLAIKVISQEALKSYDLVFDAVYTPKVTRLLREAEEIGVTVVSGLEMFIRQAMGQFELFTGCPPPEKVMREITVRNT